MKKIILLTTATIILSSCSTIKTMSADTSKQYQKIGMLETTANKRVVIVNVITGKFCAESPPETQDTFSGVFTALAEATKNSVGNAKVNLSAAIEKGFGQLYKRSHSNQMYRDASYSLCQAYVNGALTDRNLEQLQKINSHSIITKDMIFAENKHYYNEYLTAQKELINIAFNTLKTEIKEFYGASNIENKTKLEIYKTELNTKVQNLDKTVIKNSENITINNENIIAINTNATKTITLKEQK